jgi:hypothetical protein
VHGEPGCAVPPVRRHHEDRIGRERHGQAVGDPDDADVDAVPRTLEDVGVGRPEPTQDHLLEQLGGGLAGPLLTHGGPPRSCGPR